MDAQHKTKASYPEARHLNPVFIGERNDYDDIAHALDTEDLRLRTIVGQQSDDMLMLCESLTRLSHPFAIVIDATP